MLGKIGVCVSLFLRKLSYFEGCVWLMGKFDRTFACKIRFGNLLGNFDDNTWMRKFSGNFDGKFWLETWGWEFFLKLGLCFSVSSGQPNVELFGYYVRFHVGKLLHLWMKYVTFPCSVTCLDLLFAHWLESEKEIIFVSVSIDKEHWRKLCSHFWFLRRKVLV